MDSKRHVPRCPFEETNRQFRVVAVPFDSSIEQRPMTRALPKHERQRALFRARASHEPRGARSALVHHANAEAATSRRADAASSRWGDRRRPDRARSCRRRRAAGALRRASKATRPSTGSRDPVVRTDEHVVAAGVSDMQRARRVRDYVGLGRMEEAPANRWPLHSTKRASRRGRRWRRWRGSCDFGEERREPGGRSDRTVRECAGLGVVVRFVDPLRARGVSALLAVVVRGAFVVPNVDDRNGPTTSHAPSRPSSAGVRAHLAWCGDDGPPAFDFDVATYRTGNERRREAGEPWGAWGGCSRANGAHACREMPQAGGDDQASDKASSISEGLRQDSVLVLEQDLDLVSVDDARHDAVAELRIYRMRSPLEKCRRRGTP